MKIKKEDLMNKIRDMTTKITEIVWSLNKNDVTGQDGADAIKKIRHVIAETFVGIL